MPNSKQRRDAARRHLERQLANRQDRQARRRKATLIATILGTLLVAAVVITTLVMVTNDSGSPSASASTSAAASTADSASPSTAASSTQKPLPSRKPTAIAARAAKTTAGPCMYAENATALTGGNLFDVGLPPDPSPAPTAASTAVFNTNLGPITVTFDAAGAPCNVESIRYLISKKFYDGTACPRSVNSGIFVVQCGDPSGTTAGGPTYTTKDENLAAAKYPAGALAMANSGANTNGSQFFFITKDSDGALGKNYTVIGHVTKGLDILQKVAQGGDDGSNSAGGGRPKIDLIFKTVTSS